MTECTEALPKLAHLAGEVTRLLEKTFGEPKWTGPRDPLDVLIRTILSQNTNDRNRDLAYEALRARYPRWDEVLAAPTAEIASTIRPAGLSNQKSVRIKELLTWIKQTYGALDLRSICQQPTEHVVDLFLQRKGVGIKTISVVLMFACGRDIFPVDTHVHRICMRLGLVPPGATAERTHHLMQPLVPKGKAYSLHMNLLRLGRTICRARKPLCALCPLQAICPSAEHYAPASSL
ncbi:MAG: endonuclease III [candidate division KSB1 bacterium]|nr:endonuclease III [candidate division KSB1 bacterium]MDZ7392240.1 endonuclease III [candidate division KSB1 bacterium]